MATILRHQSVPALRWWVQRNPAYVLSAACIACAARMFLVPAEKPPAGDLAVILITLGVLQAYEIGVTAVMLLLHRHRRSPEDQPSLFIIEAIFWTGPLIATMEMAALDRNLGLSLALAAAVVAIGELQTLARYFHWRLAWSTHAIAAALVLLVAIAQPMLHVVDPKAGTNELLLYALWWVVAALILTAIPGLRRAARARIDAGVLVAATAAALLHLWAMNHAFFGHARLFYAAVPLAAAAAAGMLAVRPGRDDSTYSLVALFFWLPVVGVVVSFSRFDMAFPIGDLPRVLRDPLFVSLALAAGAWLCGFARHRYAVLLHAAALAAIYAGERLYFSGVLRGDVNWVGPSLESSTAVERGVMVLTAAWYFGGLAVRYRARGAVAWMLVLHQFGVTSLVTANTRAAEFALLVTWAWTALLVIHLAFDQPRLLLRLMPIALLAVVTAEYADRADVQFYARAHGVFLLLALTVAGWLMPWTHYRSVAVALATLAFAPAVVRWLDRTRHGPALAMAAAGFALLAAGTAISWWKQALLVRFARVEAADPPPLATDPPAAPPGESA